MSTRCLRCAVNAAKPRPGGSGPQIHTPLKLIDGRAALVSPPRFHRERYFAVLARAAAHGKFPRRPRTAGIGRRH